MAEFNLNELNRLAFGYVAAPYPLVGLNVSNPVDTVKTVIKAFKKRSGLGNEYFMPVEIDGILLPHEPMLMISGSQKVVRTPVAGPNRKGTIKEITAFDDYRIRIRGVVTNESDFNAYPSEGIRALKDLFEKGRLGSVKIQCDLTTIFNISQIVIEDFALRGIEGTPGAEAYEISCYSDDDELYKTVFQ